MADARIENTGACVFDAYGTLFDVHAAANRCRSDIGEKCDLMSDIWRQKQLQYTWLRSLMNAHVDFWQITGDALDYAMETTGISKPGLRETLMSLYLELDAYPEVPGVIETLREAGHVVATLSNGSPKMLDAAVRSAGIPLDAVLSVEEVGIYKPDGRVYQLAVDRLGIPAERICFMSSNAWDVAGAAHFGFKVVWCNRFGHKRERLPGRFLAEIGTLAELPYLLGLSG